MKNYFWLIFLLLFSNSLVAQTDTINIYGPGGPYPPINEIVKNYCKANDVYVNITKGPVPKWENKAKQNADIIYSGSEFMMTSLVNIITDIDEETIYPLYLRRSGLLVRPGNPKNIIELTDVLKPGIKIMVVHGSGLTGMWEDMIGRTENIDDLRKLRQNIMVYTANSGVAKKEWISDKSIDVWITWNIWQIANSDLADFISVDKAFTIYRDCGIALTKEAKNNQSVYQLFEYIKSDEAKLVFEKWGWMVE